MWKNIKLRFPFLSSLLSFTYLEKSPKLKITIEKYAKIVPPVCLLFADSKSSIRPLPWNKLSPKLLKLYDRAAVINEVI